MPTKSALEFSEWQGRQPSPGSKELGLGSKTKTKKVDMTYSSSLAVGRQRFARRNQNATSFQSGERALGPISNAVILIVLACLLGLLYLTQVTKTNSFSYGINALNEKQKELQEEHNDLEVASARLQALDRIKNSEVAKQLISVAPAATLTN